MEGEVTEQLIEATRHQVEIEMKDFLDTALAGYKPDMGLPQEVNLAKLDYFKQRLLWQYGSSGYFNNFIFNLPGSRLRESLEKSRVDMNQTFEDTRNLHSALRQEQTFKQFFDTIDKAIEDEGLDINEVIRLNEEAEKLNDASKLHKYVFPVFIRLRAIEYNRYDLVE